MLFLRASLLRALLLVLAVLALMAAPGLPVAVPVAHAADCQFVLGFQTLHELIPNVLGGCLDDEQHNLANGDALQHTTNGLLVWRKADNFTAFTDGYRTWVNGPYGVQVRLNSERFSWEANPDGLPVVASSAPGRCDTNQVEISQAGGGVAVGNVGVTFRIRSLAAQPCWLFGYSGALLLDANHQPMATTLRWSRSGYLIGTVPEDRVVLDPGGVAYFVLQYTDVPGPPGQTCPTASYLEVTPPDAYTHAVVPVHGVAPCGGNVTATPVLAKDPLAA